MGFSETLLNIFFPKTCPVCGKTVETGRAEPCAACAKEIRYIREPRCGKCGRPLYDQDRALCAECEKGLCFFDAGACVFEYSAGIRRSIHQFKYGNRRDFADFYAREAARVYGSQIAAWNIDALVPVPVHRSREIKRGYNQSLCFANALSVYTGIPVEKKALIRVKKTVPQKDLTAAMRFENLKDAFAVCRERLDNISAVLLLDDIYTTGSTINACSRILKKAGVMRVYFLCVSAGGT